MTVDSSNDPAARLDSATLRIVGSPRVHAWALDVQDDHSAQRVPFGGDTLIVGSGRGADIIVRDPTVSGRHCSITRDCEMLAVRDLGSKNGTFVGGARVQEAWGAVGTVVTIGRSSLVLAEELDDGAETPDELPLADIAGASTAMRCIAARVRRLATRSQPVLIAGETGTGKELIARALHMEGPRRSKPFVVINVAALPRELVESELFGHERGAFTGAVATRRGAFAEADGGTLFLDEIGELPLEAQPKLLRALDGYEVRRVGASGSGHRVDVRLVTASHAPLEERVERGTFRRDLFHRLEVFVIAVPPLRARPGDIAAIARRVLADASREIGTQRLTSSAVARLVAHDWPGNVRELRNVLVRAADIGAVSGVIDAADLERALRARPSDRPPPRARGARGFLTPSLARALFEEHARNLSAAARAAGYPRTSFRKLLRA